MLLLSTKRHTSSEAAISCLLSRFLSFVSSLTSNVFSLESLKVQTKAYVVIPHCKICTLHKISNDNILDRDKKCFRYKLKTIYHYHSICVFQFTCDCTTWIPLLFHFYFVTIDRSSCLQT